MAGVEEVGKRTTEVDRGEVSAGRVRRVAVAGVCWGVVGLLEIPDPSSSDSLIKSEERREGPYEQSRALNAWDGAPRPISFVLALCGLCVLPARCVVCDLVCFSLPAPLGYSPAAPS